MLNQTNKKTELQGGSEAGKFSFDKFMKTRTYRLKKTISLPQFKLQKSQTEIMVDIALHTKVNIYGLAERQIYVTI